jgi:hypothetical protein
MTKEEMTKAEAALAAEELTLKRKWCALKGHRWDLPAVSPFNHDVLECLVICNRCNAHALLNITIDSVPAAPTGTTAPTAPSAAAATATSKAT